MTVNISTKMMLNTKDNLIHKQVCVCIPVSRNSLLHVSADKTNLLEKHRFKNDRRGNHKQSK